MNLPQRLLSAWETLEAGSHGEILSRTLRDLGVENRHVRLGRDSQGCWELLIRLPTAMKRRKHVDVRGVDVLSRTITTVGGPETMLVFRCTGERYRRVFSRFSADLIEQTKGAENPADEAIRILSTWQELFGRAQRGKEKLLRGVFAELTELELLARTGGTIDATVWRGPHAEPQDFRSGTTALEIKSVPSWAAPVRINGLAQLDARPFELLALGLVLVRPDTNGRTIKEMAERLISLGIAPDDIWNGLSLLDLDRDMLWDPHSPRFAVVERRYFRVTRASPVLTEASLQATLPKAVLAVTYELDVDHLEGLSADEVLRMRARLTDHGETAL